MDQKRESLRALVFHGHAADEPQPALPGQNGGRIFLLRMKAEDDAAALFAEGLELFNAGRFFECHEAWERIWKTAQGTERLLYHGLIQAAVAILHAQRGNLRGAASVYARSREKLNLLPSNCMQLGLDEFRTSLENFFRSAIPGMPLPKPPQLRRIPPNTTG